MATKAQIQIPAAYQGDLEPVASQDTRSDDEILASLLEFRPITSEKNIWAYWNTGVNHMPGWCQRNVVGWHRICGPEWTIRVLDSVPGSANNATRWFPEGLPDTFYDGTMDGPFVGPHSADLLRGAFLYEYGGVWMDVSIFLVRHVERICWDMLENETSRHRVAVPVMGTNLLNCFLAARKHDPFIRRWHELFIHLWQGRTNTIGLSKHPLMAPVFDELWRPFTDSVLEALGIKDKREVTFEYGLQCACWLRLCMLEDAGDDFSGVEYWLNNVLWIDSPAELQHSVRRPTNDVAVPTGQLLFDLLSTRRDSPADSEQHEEAKYLVWNQLTKTSMLKIGTARGLADWVSAGILWNLPENLGKDNEPGTFAELLRYGSVHFKQKREQIGTLVPKKPSVTFKKGLLEP